MDQRHRQDLIDAAVGLRLLTEELIKRGDVSGACAADRALAALLWVLPESARGTLTTVHPLGEALAAMDEVRQVGRKRRLDVTWDYAQLLVKSVGYGPLDPQVLERWAEAFNKISPHDKVAIKNLLLRIETQMREPPVEVPNYWKGPG